jgi:hypothetical protein
MIDADTDTELRADQQHKKQLDNLEACTKSARPVREILTDADSSRFCIE